MTKTVTVERYSFDDRGGMVEKRTESFVEKGIAGPASFVGGAVKSALDAERDKRNAYEHMQREAEKDAKARLSGSGMGNTSGMLGQPIGSAPQPVYTLCVPDREVFLFLSKVEQEIVRARKKFPGANANMTALTEEVGELAKALLSEPTNRIMAEAVQVACMAARVALEGDPTLHSYRAIHAADTNACTNGATD